MSDQPRHVEFVLHVAESLGIDVGPEQEAEILTRLAAAQRVDFTELGDDGATYCTLAAMLERPTCSHPDCAHCRRQR